MQLSAKAFEGIYLFANFCTKETSKRSSSRTFCVLSKSGFHDVEFLSKYHCQPAGNPQRMLIPIQKGFAHRGLHLILNC